ncbi:glycoside hydrolase family 79 protein [Xylogone sp. PMI_703]|nr:glycoside hydrolase family 79 protein [Xylogone sp. PMI_703]
MAPLTSVLTLAQLALLVSGTAIPAASVSVSGNPPTGASAPIPEAFVSYSLEFAFFPDFAGNRSSPNKFSDNLLNNLGKLQGTKPYIRVGGNTQDYAIFNESPTRSPDYPTTLYIGPSYFESYGTWPNTKFVHGFNLGQAGNNSVGWESLIKTVPYACKALEGGKLLWWEYGNEPDLYSTSAQGPVRPPSWNESTYVAQWLEGTRAIKAGIAKACPKLLSKNSYGYMAPSFAGTNNHLKPLTTWQDGIDADKDIKQISSHNYMGGATQPGVTLQGTLMNHTMVINSATNQANLGKALSYTGIPFVLGEHNSLYNQGKPGLSNSFGAALWGVDFNLYIASLGIRRSHMHQGTDYRYASWQPVETDKTAKGTKAPYYGNIAVAAMLGDVTKKKVQIANIPLSTSYDAAYAAYDNGRLARIMVINLRQYNYTVNGTSDIPNPVKRPSQKYSFQLPKTVFGEATIQTLHANGSDAITGITWDGLSYNYELDNGKPVRLRNVTTGEKVLVWGGKVTLDVQDSSAAILHVPLL